MSRERYLLVWSVPYCSSAVLLMSHCFGSGAAYSQVQLNSGYSSQQTLQNHDARRNLIPMSQDTAKCDSVQALPLV